MRLAIQPSLRSLVPLTTTRRLLVDTGASVAMFPELFELVFVEDGV